MVRRSLGTSPPHRTIRQHAQLRSPGRPPTRGEALLLLLQEHPGLSAADVARLWGTSRQNVWNVAHRLGISMAGGRQRWAQGPGL